MGTRLRRRDQLFHLPLRLLGSILTCSNQGSGWGGRTAWTLDQSQTQAGISRSHCNAGEIPSNLSRVGSPGNEPRLCRQHGSCQGVRGDPCLPESLSLTGKLPSLGQGAPSMLAYCAGKRSTTGLPRASTAGLQARSLTWELRCHMLPKRVCSSNVQS